ncbi:MAG: alpha/beta hydrolase [Desulfobulbaceae bacterium]|nr:alpha/beta hydrolase [Desulfobulbaceae bacterium]
MKTKEHIIRQDYSRLDTPAVLGRLFCPRREERGDAPDGCVDLELEVEEGICVGVRLHLAEELSGPNILFFHGNGETARDYDLIGPSFCRLGISFLVVDYRGYGWSGGTPTATNLVRDCYPVFDRIREFLTAAGRTGQLAVMGRSLGSVCALELAAFRSADFAGLIIESGFATTMPVLTNLGVDTAALGLSEADGFGNLLKIKAYQKPVLIIHAMNDELIPLNQAGDLQAECPALARELQMVPGAGHNDIMAKTGRMYFEVLKKFVGRMGRPPRRKKSGVR